MPKRLDGTYTQYRPDALPILQRSRIDVKIGVAFRALHAMDQQEGTFNVGVWFRLKWYDEYLRWKVGSNSSSGIPSPDMVALPADMVWTPDMVLYNSAEKPMSQLLPTQVNVYSSGLVMWSQPGTVVATCSFDLLDFPDDIQRCHVKFGSWAYNSASMHLSTGVTKRTVTDCDPGSSSGSSCTVTEVDFPGFDPVFDLTMMENKMESEWILSPDEDAATRTAEGELQQGESGSVFVHDEYFAYDGYAVPYQTFLAHFTAQRKGRFYKETFLGPALFVTLTIVLSVFIPVSEGERISFATTMTLTLAVFLLIVADHLPKSGQRPMLVNVFSALLYCSLAFLVFLILYSRSEALQVERQLDRDREKKNLKRAPNGRRFTTADLSHLSLSALRQRVRFPGRKRPSVAPRVHTQTGVGTGMDGSGAVEVEVVSGTPPLGAVAGAEGRLEGQLERQFPAQ